MCVRLCVCALQVTFVVYLAALLSFVGWFFFVLYAGVGLIAVPKDLLDAYIHRPRLLSPATVANFKKTIAESAAELHKIGENLRREIEVASQIVVYGVRWFVLVRSLWLMAPCCVVPACRRQRRTHRGGLLVEP